MEDSASVATPPTQRPRRLLSSLGIVADLTAIFSFIVYLFHSGVRVIAVSSSLVAMAAGVYIVARHWRQQRRGVPLIGVATALVGALLLTTVAAYGLGRTRSEGRIDDLQAENSELEQEKDGLATELEQMSNEGPASENGATSTSIEPADTVQYLSETEMVEGPDYPLTPGDWTVDSTPYPHSVGFDIGCANGNPGVAEYNLGRKYSRFRTTVGLSENAETGTVATVKVQADDTVLVDEEVGLGETIKVDRSVKSVYRLTLIVQTNECYENRDAAAVFGDATLIR